MKKIALFTLCTLFLSIAVSAQRSDTDTIPKRNNRQMPSLLAVMPMEVLQEVAEYESNYEKTDARDALNKEEIAELEEGDILLRRGLGGVSEYVADWDNHPYKLSHCAFVLIDGYDTPHILHALPNTGEHSIKIQPIETFFKESAESSLVVVRSKGNKKQRKALTKEAKQFSEQKIPFDPLFNEADHTYMYCTEMMQVVFEFVYQEKIINKLVAKHGIDALAISSNFINPEYFDIIIDHQKPEMKSKDK